MEWDGERFQPIPTQAEADVQELGRRVAEDLHYQQGEWWQWPA
jgi:hypothetical protein